MDLQAFHVAFEFWSAVFCAMAAVCVLAPMKFDRKEAKSVLGLLLTNILINTAEALAYIYRGDTSTFGYFAVRIVYFHSVRIRVF